MNAKEPISEDHEAKLRHSQERQLRLAFVGSIPPPVTGMRLANQVLHEYLKQKYEVHLYETLAHSGLGRLSVTALSSVSISVKSILRFVLRLRSHQVVYITPGQSALGFLKSSIFVLLARAAKVPIVAHLHGNRLPKLYNNTSPAFRTFMQVVISSTDSIICLTPALARSIDLLFPGSKTRVVGNFVEDRFFIDSAEKKKFDTVRILFLSNLFRSKGILELLQAVEELHNDGVKVHLDIAGALVDKEVETGINAVRERVSECVTYHGFVTGELKRELLLSANVLALPSYYENEAQPFCLLEGMAAGNIIITTEWGGIPDFIVEGVNGFFVESRSSKSIAETLKMAWQEKELLHIISAQNIDEAREKYTVNKFCKNIEGILVTTARNRTC